MKNNSYYMRGMGGGGGNKMHAGRKTEKEDEDRGMKIWQSAGFVVSGSSKRQPRQRSCLLRLMGNRRCETHLQQPTINPRPAQIPAPSDP